MAQAPTLKGSKAQVVAMLEPDTVEEIDRIAARNSVSRSAVLRWAVMHYLQQQLAAVEPRTPEPSHAAP